MSSSSALTTIIHTILSSGKGILAADESTGTIKKRLASIGLENTVEHRQQYRNLLFSTPEFADYISGVILFDETVDQQADDGRMFSQMIAEAGAVPGVKSDQGKDPHPSFSLQTLTKGLDGHAERLENWKQRSNGLLGFTKWRQVIVVEEEVKQEFLDQAMDILAQQAKIAIGHGYVPINEPEVLMDGTHSIEHCAEITARTLRTLYNKCEEHGVDVSQTLLKPNMVLSGKETKVDLPEEVAQATIEVFERTVPSEVPGIVFLSGGQSPIQATENLNTIAALAKERSCPWTLSFSYGRALQEDALKAWAGKKESIQLAQAAFAHRARMNGRAQQGQWSKELEKEMVGVR